MNLADSLVVKGFEYKTWNNNGSNVTFANMYFRVYPSDSPSGSFTQIQTNSPISVSGNDKTWQVTNGTTNLLNGLTPGNYTIQIYTESYTNGVNTAGNIFGFTSGGNPTATFTLVPELSAALLGGIGLAALDPISRFSSATKPNGWLRFAFWVSHIGRSRDAPCR